MNAELLDILRGAHTPTVCNAIEVVQGKRGFSQFTRGTMISTAPGEPAVVGYAVTAKIAALRPASEPTDVIRARRIAYYRAMHDAPKPSVAVVEDMDFPNCIGAYWGEINTTVHKGFAMSGAVTNGVVRDLGDLPTGFPVIAGSIGPSHGFVHVVSIGEPVSIFGLEVRQGDLIHADRHGSLVVPRDVLAGLGGAIAKLRETEQLILNPARDDGFDFAAFETAWSEFEKART
jgi:regulator of RNase E activity RraA